MTAARSGDGLSYAAAGVDIAAGERAVDLIKAAVATTARPEVIGGLGGFAGLFDASRLTGYRRPLLATATDGVGTKVVLARQLGVYDTIGIDLVGMVVDDLAVCGAEPLFLTDYVVCGQVRPERVAAIVSGVARGCVLAGCALIGGETAEHPGHLDADDFDLAGAATGVVEADRLLGPDRVAPGDAVIAMASSGLHSNGFSLVRRVLDRARSGPGPDPAGARATARRGTADPDPHLRPRLPGPGRGLRRARLRPRDRGRAGPEPGPGAPRRCRRRARPRRPGPRRRCSACSPRTAASPHRNWSASSTWAWAWSPWSGRAMPIARYPGWRPGASPPG